jgi:hypothetical protein
VRTAAALAVADLDDYVKLGEKGIIARLPNNQSLSVFLMG